jgi:hypothetical protein
MCEIPTPTICFQWVYQRVLLQQNSEVDSISRTTETSYISLRLPGSWHHMYSDRPWRIS